MRTVSLNAKYVNAHAVAPHTKIFNSFEGLDLHDSIVDDVVGEEATLVPIDCVDRTPRAAV